MNVNQLTPPFINTEVEIRILERLKSVIDDLMDETKVIVEGRCIHCGSSIIGGLSVLHEVDCPVGSARWLSWELRDALFAIQLDRDFPTIT